MGHGAERKNIFSITTDSQSFPVRSHDLCPGCETVYRPQTVSVESSLCLRWSLIGSWFLPKTKNQERVQDDIDVSGSLSDSDYSFHNSLLLLYCAGSTTSLLSGNRTQPTFDSGSPFRVLYLLVSPLPHSTVFSYPKPLALFVQFCGKSSERRPSWCGWRRDGEIFMRAFYVT